MKKTSSNEFGQFNESFGIQTAVLTFSFPVYLQSEESLQPPPTRSHYSDHLHWIICLTLTAKGSPFILLLQPKTADRQSCLETRLGRRKYFSRTTSPSILQAALHVGIYISDCNVYNKSSPPENWWQDTVEMELKHTQSAFDFKWTERQGQQTLLVVGLFPPLPPLALYSHTQWKDP